MYSKLDDRQVCYTWGRVWEQEFIVEAFGGSVHGHEPFPSHHTRATFSPRAMPGRNAGEMSRSAARPRSGDPRFLGFFLPRLLHRFRSTT